MKEGEGDKQLTLSVKTTFHRLHMELRQSSISTDNMIRTRARLVFEDNDN